MYVAICRVDILIPHSRSLKDKRQVIRSIVSRLKNKNLSVSEINLGNQHQKSAIGIAVTSNVKDKAEEIIQKTIDFIEDNYPVELISVELELTQI